MDSPKYNTVDDAVFKALFDAAQDAVCIAADGLYVYLNQAYATLCGYENADSLIGTAMPDLMNGRRADGSICEVEVSCSTARIGDKLFTMSIARAIAPKDSEDSSIEDRRNAAILDSIADAFVALDDGLCCTYANRLAELLLGCAPGAWNNTHASKLFSQPLAGEIIRQSQEALSEQASVTFEARYAEEDLEVRLIPSPDGLSVYLRDITEQKRSLLERRNEVLRQRIFVRHVLESVTDGRLQLCDTDYDLPKVLSKVGAKRRLDQSDGLAQLRRDAREAAEELGFDEKICIDLEIATGEAGMNAIVHAGSGYAWVCSDGSGTIQIWVQDRGKGIDFEKLPQATLQRGYSSSGTMGHGFKIILKTAHRVWLLTGSSGTTVVLEQHRSPEPEFKL